MRKRTILSLALIFIGVVLIVAAVVSWITDYAPPVNPTILAVSGVPLLIIGLLILITEIFETWLSRGQTALVDGLQAG